MPTEHFNRLKVDRKSAIIKAATREFATKDYSEVSVRDIADAAEISRGSFYLYFADKEDAYLTVIQAYNARIEQDLLHIYLQANTIQDIVLDVFDYFTHLSTFEQNLFEKISNNLSTDVQDLIISAFDNFGENINIRLESEIKQNGIEITPEIHEQITLRREILFSLLLSSIVGMSVGRTPLEAERASLLKKVNIILTAFNNDFVKAYDKELLEIKNKRL